MASLQGVRQSPPLLGPASPRARRSRPLERFSPDKTPRAQGRNGSPPSDPSGPLASTCWLGQVAGLGGIPSSGRALRDGHLLASCFAPILRHLDSGLGGCSDGRGSGRHDGPVRESERHGHWPDPRSGGPSRRKEDRWEREGTSVPGGKKMAAPTSRPCAGWGVRRRALMMSAPVDDREHLGGRSESVQQVGCMGLACGSGRERLSYRPEVGWSGGGSVPGSGGVQ